MDKVTEVVQKYGKIIEDRTNVNGRFITVVAAKGTRRLPYDLANQLKPLFARVSTPSYDNWSNSYSFQCCSKAPSICAPGCIYPADAFGDITYVEVK